MARLTPADLAAYAARTGLTIPDTPAPATGGPARGQQTAPGGKAGEKAEQALCRWLDVLGIEYAEQYAWGAFLEPPRKFRSDLRLIGTPVLVEVEGQAHAIKDKRRRDLERHNLGTAAGWLFLRFAPDQAISGEASLFIQKYLEARR